MCGIAGYIARRDRPVDRLHLEHMCAAVQHRGPDGGGIVISGRVGFGHRRLSIFDLSDQAAQPMTDGRTGCSIIFNGAIYNHPELRTELGRRGRHFHSGSDTEVILAAYDAWGADCVNRFNGMWAFAIHDPRTGTVFCSRDRFGVKPFYFVETADCFAFGSEIRQLLPLLPTVQAQREVLVDFIFTAACDHREETFFAGVRKLPAGHTLTYELDRDTHRVQRYYRLERRAEAAAWPLDQAVEAYRLGLTDAVRLRLRSDVPVGSCLSGGLDSSSIASLAAQLQGAACHDGFTALTAVSEDPANDESAHAQSVARHAHLRWVPVRPVYESFAASLDDVVVAQEEPFAGPSVCMQYFVMAAARAAGIKVLLDGQGGDETLLGYERYFASHYRTTGRRHGVLGMLGAIRDSARHNSRMSARNIAGYLAWFSSPRLRYRYLQRRHSYLQTTPQLPEHLQRYATASRDEFDLQRLEIESTNLPALLRYEDKNSMRNGIETRLPFLDYRLVELALSLPGEHKIRQGWTKYVLRRAMSDILPETVTWRRDKRGFEAPDALWLQRHARHMDAAIRQSRIIDALADTGRLMAQWPGLDGGTRWRLFSIALWERRFGVAP